MIPLFALVFSFCLFSLLGRIWFPYFADYHHALRPALAIMFLLTASAHWGSKRVDFVRMVPASFKRPELWVTPTGILEILGAIGLLIPFTAPLAAGCLALMLVALFPANVYAARHHLTIGGRPVPSLVPCMIIQIVFVVSAFLAVLG